MSEVDEGIRCKGKHWKHPLFFPGVDWEIISSTDIYFAQKKTGKVWNSTPQKKPGFRSFFHRKKKSAKVFGERWDLEKLVGLKTGAPMVS